MKIRLAGAELFHADGRWERRLTVFLAILRMRLKAMGFSKKCNFIYWVCELIIVAPHWPSVKTSFEKISTPDTPCSYTNTTHTSLFRTLWWNISCLYSHAGGKAAYPLARIWAHLGPWQTTIWKCSWSARICPVPAIARGTGLPPGVATDGPPRYSPPRHLPGPSLLQRIIHYNLATLQTNMLHPTSTTYTTS